MSSRTQAVTFQRASRWEKVKEFLFRSNAPRQTVVKNTLWLFASQVVSRSLRAAIFVYAARVLGAGQYGVFSLAQSIAGLLMLFSDLGVNPVISREVAKGVDQRSRWIATGFFLKMFVLTLSLVATGLFSLYFDKRMNTGILLAVISFVFFLDGIREFWIAVVRALEKMQWEALVSFLANSVTVVAGLVLLKFWKTPLHLALAYLLGSVVGVLAILFAIRSDLRGLVHNVDWSLSRHTLQVAWPFVVWAMLGSLLVYTDSIMLGGLKDARTVGFYNAGSKLVLFLLALPELLTASVFPTFARRAVNGNFLSPFVTSFRVTVLVALPLVLGGVILGKSIIYALYGDAYRQSVPVFQILLLLLLFHFPGVVVGSAVFAYNRHFEILRYVAISAFANVLLNWFLIPQYGAVGSAVATVLSRSVAVVGAVTILIRIQPFPIFTALWRPLSAAVVMGTGLGIASYVQLNLWLSLFLGASIYLLTLYALREPLLGDVYSTLSA